MREKQNLLMTTCLNHNGRSIMKLTIVINMCKKSHIKEKQNTLEIFSADVFSRLGSLTLLCVQYFVPVHSFLLNRIKKRKRKKPTLNITNWTDWRIDIRSLLDLVNIVNMALCCSSLHQS